MLKLETLTFKVAPDDAMLIRRRAKVQNRSLSAYLRACALPFGKPRRPKLVPKRHPVSGGWYNAAPGQVKPSLEELQEALEEIL